MATIFEENTFDWNNNTTNIVDSFFRKSNQLVKHQLDSFNDFIINRIPEILDEINANDKINSLFDDWNNEKKRHNVQLKINFGKFYIAKPTINEQDGKERPMYPKDARLRNLTYSSSIYVDIHATVIKYNTRNEKPEVVELPVIEKFNIGRLPIMLNCNFCTLYGKPEIFKVEKGECNLDCGGYFVINGNEKVVVAHERMCENKIYVFALAKQAVNKYIDIAEIKCIQEGCSVPIKVQVLLTNRESTGGRTIKCSIPKVHQDIPLFVMFRALGIISDKEILEYIVGDLEDKSNQKFVQLLRNSLEEANSITTQLMALEYISKYLILPVHMRNLNDENSEDIKFKLVYTHSIIVQDLFSHLYGTSDDIKLKAFFLGHMTLKMLKAHLGIIPYEDRDSFMNKRVDTTGPLFAKLFRQNFTRLINDAKKQLKKTLVSGKFSELQNAIMKAFKPITIEQNIKSAMSTGVWGLKGNPNNPQGVAQILTRLTYASFLSHLRRIIAPIEKQIKISQPRKLHGSQIMYIDPSETPEGASIGIVKNMALSTGVTRKTSPEPVFMALKEKGMRLLQSVPRKEVSHYCKIFLNGAWLGIHDNPPYLVSSLQNLRRKGTLDMYTSISWHVEQNEINILTDAGRLTRPLYIVKNNKALITNELANKIEKEQLGWDDLVTNLKNETGEAVIEYIDVEESNSIIIAMTMQDLKDNNRKNEFFYKYTHLEIDPQLMFGVVIGNIPFPDHNQAPRNTYQGAQAKQAIGIYATNFRRRLDTVGHVLYYPQKPLVYPKMSKYLHSRKLPAGANIIVAIACYTGYNMEDSLILNQSSIDRGLFISSYFRKFEDREKKNQSALDDEKFDKPEEFYPDGVKKKTKGMKASNYDLLDSNGFVKVGSKVKNNDVIIGKVIPRKVTSENEPRFIDSSTVIKKSEEGVVDWLYSNRDHDGYRFVKVRIRSERKPQIGDKFSSRSAQKGTVGITYCAADMPFNGRTGVAPDLIMNPHAIPSRMTIGQLIECLTGKVAAIKGVDCDASPFTTIDPNDIAKCLLECGYEHYGKELLTNGKTGKQFMSEIFIGPTFYQRLKHMVDDKIHSRSIGPYQILTRQSSEGRSRDGGLRFGEMERDCILSHGAMQFLKERLFDVSDKYLVYICKKTGMIAAVNPDQNVHESLYCETNKTDFAKVKIPYASKLFVQELMTMGIQCRMVTD